MGYLANKSDVQLYQPAIDYFSGNGATSQFTLSRPVASVAQIIVSVANVIQNPNTFSVNNNILTLGGNAPTGTNNIWVQYQTAVIQVNQPGQGTVGAGQMMPGAALANIGIGGIGQSYLAAGVAGNGPAFSAYQSGAQTLSSNTWTKIQFQTEEFDTANCFDNSTNYRFTPTVAGYYQVSGSVTISSTTTNVYGKVYKNGVGFKMLNYAVSTNNSQGSCLIYLNGSTDYIELYGYLVAGQALGNSYESTYFQAALVRAA